jgi:shikimate kinase
MTDHAKKHLILVGMMGTGKTSTGRELARLLGMPWVDTDAVIERRSGMTVSDFFARFGEEAFRDEESRVLSELLAGPPSLLTTGGGIVLREENRRQMLHHGLVVHLHATPEEIVRRLAGTEETRPLLKENLKERVVELSLRRAEAYRFADFMVDTTGRTVSEVAQTVLKLWRGFKAGQMGRG